MTPDTNLPELPADSARVESVAPAPPARENPVWNGLDVLVLAAVIVFSAFLFSIASISIAVAVHVDGVSAGMSLEKILDLLGTDVRVLLPAQFVAYLVVLFFMVQIVRRRYRQLFLRSIRWNWPSDRWAVFLAVGVILAFAVGLLTRYLPETKHLPIDSLFQGRGSAFLLAIFAVGIAPFMEEFFFRGFLYPVLVRRMGMVWAVVLTALGFMTIHASQLAGSWSPLLAIFLVGVVLTLVRAYAGSVAASVLTHMGYNGTIFLLLYFGTQGFRHLDQLTK